ncbi:MAG: response regulator transcription factor [Patescibacteria group bacterium]|jgi:DNA-binding response OmpR family regulator
MKILLVEDEESIREVVKRYLERAGFQVDEAGSGPVALLKAKQGFDLIILDLNLPNLDGVEVCKKIRETSNVPILMATARVEEGQELTGLSVGADDYIKKPYSPKVLVAHVQALLRRASQPGSRSRGQGSITCDDEQMALRRGDETIGLTATQYRIARALFTSPGRIFSRTELLEASRNGDSVGETDERVIDAHIKSLRRRIEADQEQPKHILTVVGVGYKAAV